jgi:hypothetical protein
MLSFDVTHRVAAYYRVNLVSRSPCILPKASACQAPSQTKLDEYSFGVVTSADCKNLIKALLRVV